MRNSSTGSVLGLGMWKIAKAGKVLAELPHPFMAEMIALPASFGALGAGVGSVTEGDDTLERFALTAGLMGLGIALGRGAGAKFLKSPKTVNLRHSLSGAGLGSGALASDVILPEMNYEPVFGNT